MMPCIVATMVPLSVLFCKRSGDRMDRNDRMAHLLPADPQQDMGQSGHLEAIHLIHVVMHWLAILMAAVLLLWLLGLVLSLLGWLAWSLTWLARRLLHGIRHR